ncbi:hypothetical protein sos41_12360 [Alphaproteobacteria bacterium SO-S41]|nr:hypothetical protein sos41_12360 [Alphaproteobacteria bacterium SO-S41]
MSAPGPEPRVSVIIATYNWSAALACALQSVLYQTMDDFEVLVVGDACTDDSAAVVAALGDPRVTFFNLEERCGSQWGPNNFGLSRARGAFVAYLGHDDIWWPDHLEVSLAAAEREAAEVTAALTIMYGPPGSGVFCHSGLFPGSIFQPEYFFVPSSMLHRRALIERTGPWRSAAEAGRQTDVDFVRRLRDADAHVVETAELTVFKFNAAWRRGAYLERSVAEQQALLAKARSGGNGFRRAELVKTLRSVLEGRGTHFEFRDPPAGAAESDRTEWARFKGSLAGATNAGVSALSAPMRFRRTSEHPGYEWYALEAVDTDQPFRWSGPSTVSSIVLPLRPDAPFELCIDIVHVIEFAALETLEVSINGEGVEHMREHLGSAWRIRCAYTPRAGVTPPSILVTFKIARTLRPIDLTGSQDRRWLGIAVGTVELAPALASAA